VPWPAASRTQLCRSDVAEFRYVERDRLRGIAVLRKVVEEAGVERAELGALELLCVRSVRGRIAVNAEVVGGARITGGRAAPVPRVQQADLLALCLAHEVRCRGRATVADEVSGALAEPFTALVHVLAVDPAAVLASVRAHVRLPDEREPRDRVVPIWEVPVDRFQVCLELAELLFDAREDEHTLEVGVGVANAVESGGEREHRLARPARALQREEAAVLGGVDRGVDPVSLLGVRLCVAEEVGPRGGVCHCGGVAPDRS